MTIPMKSFTILGRPLMTPLVLLPFDQQLRTISSEHLLVVLLTLRPICRKPLNSVFPRMKRHRRFLAPGGRLLCLILSMRSGNGTRQSIRAAHATADSILSQEEYAYFIV